MKENKLLVVLDRFRWLFVKFGVNYPVMRRILQVKLTMDGRRMPTIIGKSRNKGEGEADRLGQDNDKNQFFRSLWLYLILGAFSSIFVAMGDNYIFQMSFVFGIFIFMIMTSLISDFSSVLLDIRDRNILSTKPVDGRTIAMAKTLHILIYMFFVTGALGIVPLGVGLVRHGFGFFLLFLLELILMDLLIVVLTALVYLGVLKFFDGEKLKDLINYVQIGLTIGVALGYQLLIRLFEFIDLEIAFQPKWWQFVIIPIWFGAPFETLLHGDRTPLFFYFSILALIVPILAFLLYIKLMPSLEKNLQKLADPGSRQKAGARKWLRPVSRLLCSSPQEQVFFRFAWTMMGTEREFKLKVYPSIGFSLIFPFIFLFANGANLGVSGLAGTKYYLYVYFCALMVPSIIFMLKFSGSYKAAWIYRVLPVNDLVPVYRGTLIAAVVRLILPLFIVDGVIFGLLFGAEIIPDLIVTGLAILAYTVISFAYLDKSPPFSERFEAAQQSNGIRMLPLLLLLGGLALLHLAATFVSFGIYVYAAVLLAANWFLWQRAFNMKQV